MVRHSIQLGVHPAGDLEAAGDLGHTRREPQGLPRGGVVEIQVHRPTPLVDKNTLVRVRQGVPRRLKFGKLRTDEEMPQRRGPRPLDQMPEPTPKIAPQNGSPLHDPIEQHWGHHTRPAAGQHRRCGEDNFLARRQSDRLQRALEERWLLLLNGNKRRTSISP